MQIGQFVISPRSLFRWRVLPGWLLLTWKLLSALSNVEFVANHKQQIQTAMQFFTTPGGNLIIIAVGILWIFIAAATGQAKPKQIETADTPRTEDATQSVKYPEMGGLFGCAFDGEGSPLRGVAIVARNDETEREYLGSSSGEAGSFSIVVPRGIYTVTARCEGYREAAHAVIVEGVKNNCYGTTDFTLERIPTA